MRARAGVALMIAVAMVLVVAGTSQAVFAADGEPDAAELVIPAHQGKVLRTKADIYRTQIVDESICGVTLVTPRELSVLGRQPGTTDLRVWLRDPEHRSVLLRVRVVAD